MARSSRIAGGCSAPTDGNLPSGHSRLSDRDLVACSPRASPCAPGAGIAPQAEQRRSAGRQLAGDALASRRSSTITRGHGRWPGDAVAFDIIGQMPSMRFTYPSSFGDVLEPGDQRRRHIDAGARAPARDARTSARKRPSHCRVGAARLAERDAVEPQEQPAEPDQKAEHQR